MGPAPLNLQEQFKAYYSEDDGQSAGYPFPGLAPQIEASDSRGESGGSPVSSQRGSHRTEDEIAWKVHGICLGSD